MSSRPIESSAEESRVAERSRRGARTMMDEDGRLWRVREVLFADTAPSLIFESEIGFRRVRAYPEAWSKLTDVELFELSWRT
ncbi:MAG TPA: hypothetical protein VJN70_12345 [Gemmatimonadaceae bacterium]|nr:hypothetical protein [Gemmatimonadaceae bacterium]